MKISVGPYDLFTSGTVIQIDNEPIKFSFFDNNNIPLYFIIKFENDTGKKGQLSNFNLLSPDTLEVTFYNYNNAVGIGNTELIKLGSINQRKLYFNYRVYHITDIGKTFHYNFYLGEEVRNV